MFVASVTTYVICIMFIICTVTIIFVKFLLINPMFVNAFFNLIVNLIKRFLIQLPFKVSRIIFKVMFSSSYTWLLLHKLYGAIGYVAISDKVNAW